MYFVRLNYLADTRLHEDDGIDIRELVVARNDKTVHDEQQHDCMSQYTDDDGVLHMVLHIYIIMYSHVF